MFLIRGGCPVLVKGQRGNRDRIHIDLRDG